MTDNSIPTGLDLQIYLLLSSRDYLVCISDFIPLCLLVSCLYQFCLIFFFFQKGNEQLWFFSPSHQQPEWNDYLAPSISEMGDGEVRKAWSRDKMWSQVMTLLSSLSLGTQRATSQLQTRCDYSDWLRGSWHIGNTLHTVAAISTDWTRHRHRTCGPGLRT